MSPTVAIQAHGCKLNQAEAEALTLRFLQAGYTEASPESGPDVYVLNTCTVTHVADRKARQALRRARRANPDGLVVATGCYAHRATIELAEMPEVSLVVDNVDKMRLPQILGIDSYGSASDAPRPAGRTRSMIKIQEGCDQVCAYCIVPKTRGRQRSLLIKELLADVAQRVAVGYREVVLTGTQLGSYGHEFGPAPRGRTWYEELVRRILAETGVQRLRFSSLQPQEVTPGMVELYASGQLCPHVHMPLQSGSDAVLKRMRRRYDTGLYARTVARLREAAPAMGITTDVIVGFPGETGEEYEEGLRFIEAMEFSDMHVFPYSRRPGTSAAFLEGHIDPRAKRARERQMLDLARRTAGRRRQALVGRRATVLWEAAKDVDGAPAWSGLTEHYVRVYTRSDGDLGNRIEPVTLTALAPDGMWCEPVASRSRGPQQPELCQHSFDNSRVEC